MIIYDPKITGSFEVNGSSLSSLESIDNVSGSVVDLTAASASLSTRVSDQESFSSSLDATFATDAQVSTAVSSLNNATASYALIAEISGSTTSLSSSLSTRITSQESFSSSLDSTFATDTQLSTAVSSLNAASSSYLQNTTDTLTGDLTVTGTLTAQEFHTEFVSASIMYDSGSTKFGDTSDDIHNFTGSLNVLGDSTLAGSLQAQPWLFRSMGNQVEYHVLDNGSINGPSWKFRYDGVTANRYVDFGYKDGNGTYTAGLKLYDNQTISWRGTDIVNSSSQWVGGIASSGYNNSNWDTAYTYSQVGHLPLAGGTLTGGLTGTTATFSGNVGVGGKTPAYGLNLAQGTGAGNKIAWTDGTPNFAASIYANSSTDKLTFNTKNASNIETTALEIDISQNATFAGEITSGNDINVGGKLICANLASDKKIAFRRTGANNFSIEHDTSSIYFYNESTGGVPIRFFNSNNATFAGSVTVSNDFTLDNSSPEMYFKTTASHYNWMIAAQENIDTGLEFTPANAVGDSGTHNAPALTLYANRNATFAGSVTIDSSTATLNIKGSNTGASLINFSDAADGNVGRIYYDHTDNFMQFKTNDSEKLRIDSNGVIQLPQSGNNGYINFNSVALELDVNRNPETGTFSDVNKSHARISISGANGGSEIGLKVAAANNTVATTALNVTSAYTEVYKSLIFSDSAYNQAYSIRRNANALIFSGGSAGFYFNRDDNSKTDMYINGDGQVIVGNTTINGSFGASNSILAVKGSTSGGEGILQLVGLSNNATDIPARIEFHSQAEADPMCSIRATRGSADDIGDLSFLTNNGSVPQTRMRITSTGRVDIEGNVLSIDDVDEYREEFFTTGQATPSFDITMKSIGASGQPFEVFVAFTHYSTGYGCMLHQAYYQRSTAQSNISLVNTYINQTSTLGGAWSVAYVNATTIRVSKSSGTSGGSGYGYIRVTRIKP